MPRCSSVDEYDYHRSKGLPLYNAFVCRQLDKKEIHANVDAERAMQVELSKLRKGGVWNEKLVAEWSDVSSNARKSGTKVHVGRIFGIVSKRTSSFMLEIPLGGSKDALCSKVMILGMNTDSWRSSMMWHRRQLPWKPQKLAMHMDYYPAIASSRLMPNRPTSSLN